MENLPPCLALRELFVMRRMESGMIPWPAPPLSGSSGSESAFRSSSSSGTGIRRLSGCYPALGGGHAQLLEVPGELGVFGNGFGGQGRILEEDLAGAALTSGSWRSSETECVAQVSLAVSPVLILECCWKCTASLMTAFGEKRALLMAMVGSAGIGEAEVQRYWTRKMERRWVTMQGASKEVTYIFALGKHRTT